MSNVGTSESANDRDKGGLMRNVAKPQNRLKRRRVVDADAKASTAGSSRDITLPQTVPKKPRRAAVKSK